MSGSRADLAARLDSLWRTALGRLAGSLAVDGKVSSAALESRQMLCVQIASLHCELQAAKALSAHAETLRGGAAVTVGRQADALAGETFTRFQSLLWPDPGRFTLKTAEVEAFFQDPVVRRFVAEQSGAYERLGAAGDVLPVDGEAEDVALADLRARLGEFVARVVLPRAQEIHLRNLDVPDAFWDGVAALGCFGFSIPPQYGGSMEDETLARLRMVIASEELSRGSLGAAGTLLTRVEYLARILLTGGTDAQKKRWLPGIASGAVRCAVAVTEPGHGSDVAALQMRARRVDGGFVLEGRKCLCTFAARADVILTLCRSHGGKEAGARGLSLFLVEKPRFTGSAFSFEGAGGGRVEAVEMETLGYRGMKSFLLDFHSLFVPDENVVGGRHGLGRGYKWQLEGFAGGWLQTAARAAGVARAALELACGRAGSRRVFGRLLGEWGHSRHQLGRMAARTEACRQMVYRAARLRGGRRQEALAAAAAKLHASKIAEECAREAMQLHGGKGYTRECPVSRVWLDARVLSIFEGAEATLAILAVARLLLQESVECPSEAR